MFIPCDSPLFRGFGAVPVLATVSMISCVSEPTEGLSPVGRVDSRVLEQDGGLSGVDVEQAIATLDQLAGTATGKLIFDAPSDPRLRQPIIARDVVLKRWEGAQPYALPSVVVVTGDLTFELESSNCLTMSNESVYLDPAEIHRYQINNVIMTCTDANGTVAGRGLNFYKVGADGVGQEPAAAGVNGDAVSSTAGATGLDGASCGDSGTAGESATAVPGSGNVGGEGPDGNTGIDGQSVMPTVFNLSGTTNVPTYWYLMGGDGGPGQDGGRGGEGGTGQQGGDGGNGAEACCAGKCNPGQSCNLQEVTPPGAGGVGGDGGQGGQGGVGGNGGNGGSGGDGGVFIGLVNANAAAYVHVSGTTGGGGGVGGRAGSGGAGGSGGAAGLGGLSGTHCDFTAGTYAASGEAGPTGVAGMAGYSGATGTSGSNGVAVIIPISSARSGSVD